MRAPRRARRSPAALWGPAGSKRNLSGRRGCGRAWGVVVRRRGLRSGEGFETGADEIHFDLRVKGHGARMTRAAVTAMGALTRGVPAREGLGGGWVVVVVRDGNGAAGGRVHRAASPRRCTLRKQSRDVDCFQQSICRWPIQKPYRVRFLSGSPSHSVRTRSHLSAKHTLLGATLSPLRCGRATTARTSDLWGGTRRCGAPAASAVGDGLINPRPAVRSSASSN